MVLQNIDFSLRIVFPAVNFGDQLVIDIHGFNGHFTAVDASLSMIWNPGLIPRLFKSVVQSVNKRIISLLLMLFVSVVRMAFQSYTYIA